MYSLEEAKALVQRYLDSVSETPLALFDRVGEYPFGWAFPYNSCEYVENGNMDFLLVGAGPLLFNKWTGEIIPTGSGQPESLSAENYQRYGRPYVELGSSVSLTSHQPDADRLSAIRTIQTSTDVGLHAAKSIVDLCLAGRPAVVECSSVAEARDLVDQLNALGFFAQQQPQSTQGPGA